MELRWVAVEAEDKATGERSRHTFDVAVSADAEAWRAQATALGAHRYPEARTAKASDEVVTLEDARYEVTVWPLRPSGAGRAVMPPGQAALFVG